MSEQTKSSRRVGVVIGIVLLLGASAVAYYLMSTRPTARRAPASEVSVLVMAQRAVAITTHAMIEAMGTLIPAQEATLASEVSGVVVWKSDAFIEGGLVSAGDELLRMDARNYENALKQQEGALAKAVLELELERSRGAVAAEEWTLLDVEARNLAVNRELALREPHIRAAEAGVAATRAAVERAQLDLERTTIRAPFDAVILNTAADVGDLVSSQTRVARLAGIQSWHVHASLPVSDLEWIALPDVNGQGGAGVVIEQDLGNGRIIQRAGRVVRLLGDVDPAGRLARVLIEIEDPLNRSGGMPREAVPFLLGSYVRAVIEGLELADVIVLKTSWIREGEKVWIMDEDDRLDVREVQVLRRQGGRAIVRNGVQPGERVVTSRIAVPVPGMKLKCMEFEEVDADCE